MRADQQKQPQSPKISHADIQKFVEEICSEDLHAKRVLSLTDAIVGVLHGAALSVHAIGQGLARAAGLTPKHAVKQVDRLLSNSGLELAPLLALWVHLLWVNQKK